MSKAPRTVARIKSTGVFGDFPAAVLAAVEHDTYILESEAATALAEAQAHIARLEAALRSVAAGPMQGEIMESWIRGQMQTANAALARGKGEGA